MEEIVVKPRQESPDPLRRELERAQIHGPDMRTIDALEEALNRVKTDQKTVCIGENIVAMLRAGKDVTLEHQGVTLIRASDLQQALSEKATIVLDAPLTIATHANAAPQAVLMGSEATLNAPSQRPTAEPAVAALSEAVPDLKCPDNPQTCQRPTCDECIPTIVANSSSDKQETFDAEKFYTEFRTSLYGARWQDEDVATCHEHVEALEETVQAALKAHSTAMVDVGAECSKCGFRYWAHKGHIIPCPLCALSATLQIPDGWKLVPCSATEAMLRAATDALGLDGMRHDDELTWEAMLEAAPSYVGEKR